MANYSVKDLEVLSPQDHVRLRKGMYIGEGANASPLFNEVFDNALDEAQGGYSEFVEVFADLKHNEYSVTDYGRGFPQGVVHDPNSGKDLEALELLCTTAFSGGKFNSSAYKLSTGLHGVGLLVTNSLSEHFQIKTWRDGSVVFYQAKQGETLDISTSKFIELDMKRSGTMVTFRPDPEMFEDPTVPLNHIIMRCKIASAFGTKVFLKVCNKDGETEDIDVSSTIYDLLPPDDDGISEYYKYDFSVTDKESGEFASVALKYTSDTKTYYRGYTNLLYNSAGGTHNRMINEAIIEAWAKFKVPDIKPTDVLIGIRGIIAVFISDTKFGGQTKENLTVPKANLAVLKELIVEEIYNWLKDNDEIRESLIKRFQEYRTSQDKLLARKEIKSLLYINTSKPGFKKASQVHKLRECSSKSREGTELFIVEGDSAMGSAQNARDPVTQAIIPVRGKVFNVARCTNPKDALVNEETRALVNVIGAGIGEEADPEKSRYEKIIFMADADADGKEISVLLTGMFVNLLPNLVKAGMVYISLPPLYGWRDKKGELHFTNKQSEIPEKTEYSRYKGLGEMDADELRISTMDPATRRLIKLEYPEDINMFNSILTSSNVKFKMLEDQGVIRKEI